MSEDPTHIPSFPLSKRRLLLAANLFFWLSFIAFDTITTAGMLGGYVGFTFQRAIAQALILCGLVYPHLYWLYPRYFSKGRYLVYALAALSLMTLILFLRTGLDNFYLQWFLGGDFHNTPRGQLAFDTLIGSGYVKNSELVPAYYFGMILGTVAVFFVTTPIKLVEDWYQKNRLSRQVLQNQIKLQETKIKFLKAQTDPHFLINALSGVYNLALLESKNIDFAILRLSELMAYLLGHGKEDRIALKHEIHFIQNFIDFHKAINPEPIDISFEHRVGPAQMESIEIPPMLIQPFFENALKHGNAADDPEGWIKSQLEINNGQLFFSIKNTLKTSSKKVISHQVGLQNVREKLAVFFPEDRYRLLVKEDQSVYEVQLILNLSQNTPGI